jgi:hypothetical protein
MRNSSFGRSRKPPPDAALAAASALATSQRLSP